MPTSKAARARKLNPKRVSVPPDLEAQLRQADTDFERGDFIELTREQVDRAIATGASPWPDESSD